MRFKPEPQPDLMDTIGNLETIRASIIGTRQALVDGGFTPEAAEAMAALLWATILGGGE